MKLRYTPRALSELEAVLAYLAERSPQAAHRVHSRIQAATDLLLQHPYSGRLTSLGRLRRTAAIPYPYLIYYEPTGDEVVVIAVRHSARDPASMPGEDEP